MSLKENLKYIKIHTCSPHKKFECFECVTATLTASQERARVLEVELKKVAYWIHKSCPQGKHDRLCVESHAALLPRRTKENRDERIEGVSVGPSRKVRPQRRSMRVGDLLKPGLPRDRTSGPERMEPPRRRCGEAESGRGRRDCRRAREAEVRRGMDAKARRRSRTRRAESSRRRILPWGSKAVYMALGLEVVEADNPPPRPHQSRRAHCRRD